MKGALKRLLLPTARIEPLDAIYRRTYQVFVDAALLLLERERGIDAVVMRTAFDNPYFRPIMSDIDLLVILDRDPDARTLWRLRKRTRRLAAVAPVLQFHFVSRFDVEAYENTCVHQSVALADRAVLRGRFDADRLAARYDPQRGIAGLDKAMWAYLTQFHRWLYDEQHALPSWNWHKVFLKPLVFVGYTWDEAASIVDRVVPRGLSDRERVECFIEVTRALRGKLATHAFLSERPSEVRALERPKSGGVNESDVERAAAVRRTIERAIGGDHEIVVSGSSTGPHSLIAFLYSGSGDFRADDLLRTVRRWRAAKRDSLNPRATPQCAADRTSPAPRTSLYPLAPHPVFVDPLLFDASFATDVSRKYWLLDAFGAREGLNLRPGADRWALAHLLANTIVRLDSGNASPRAAREELDYVVPLTFAELGLRSSIFDPRVAEAWLSEAHSDLFADISEARRIMGARRIDRFAFFERILSICRGARSVGARG